MNSVPLFAMFGITLIISCTPKTVPAAATKTFTAEYLAQGKTNYDNCLLYTSRCV